MRRTQPTPSHIEPLLFLGVEGGGTRTVAILADGHERLLGRVEAGPANLQLLTDDQLTRQLLWLRNQFAQPNAICLGLAGLRSNTDHDRVLRAAGRVWPGIPCRACADLETAMAAAPSAQAAPLTPAARVLVLSGTGSCCHGRSTHGQSAKVGGWGHLLGDRGSGYQIGLLALQSTVSAWDRGGTWPRLGANILRSLQLNGPEDLISWIQSAAKKDVAAVAVEVFAAWHRGDRIASLAVEQAAASLALDAANCAGRLTRPRNLVQFVFAGGVLSRQPRFAKLVRDQITRLWPKADFCAAKREGAWGAVLLAMEEFKVATVETRKTLTPSLSHRMGEGRGDGDCAIRPARPQERSASAARVVQGFYIPDALGLSPTEKRNPRSHRLHQLPMPAAIRLMLSEEAKVPAILLREEEAIARAIGMIVRAFHQGGRLFYVGAGTSGRLGTLDASECPPTFRTPPEQVQAIMAGGQQALWQSIEGAEDEAGTGAEAARYRGVRPGDVVVGIAASGRTPFVWGALQEARQLGAKTILMCFNPNLKIERRHRPDMVLAFDLGPEVLTGSTRLKAGTATKLLLNAFTTLSMVRLGKVVSNLMVDLNPSNQKLRQRAIRIVRELTGATDANAEKALQRTQWRIKPALKQLGKSQGRKRILPRGNRRKAG